MDGSLERRGSGGFLFWSLSLMAMTAFAPCVFLPEWRDYEAVYSVQRGKQQDLKDFEQWVLEEKRKIEALQSDPATLARLAQRELSFRRTGERSVAVGEASETTIDIQPLFAQASSAVAGSIGYEPSPTAKAIAPWTARLPALDFDALFCDEQTRTIIMTMSLSLVVLAVVLFGRRRISDWESDASAAAE